MKNMLSEKEWREIGLQAKKARSELMALLSQTSGMLPKSINDSLHRSIQCLDRFRSKAEDKMLQVHKDGDLNIFYGSEKGGGSNNV